MTYTKEQARSFADRALAALEKEFGVGVVSRTKTTYGDKLNVTFDFKPGTDEDRAVAERNEWNRSCGLFGLKPEHYGAVITHKGTPYTLVGFEFSRRKFPIRVKSQVDGKVLLLTEEEVRLKVRAKLATVD